MNENIHVMVNGKQELIPGGASISDLLNIKTIEPARVVVEVNRCIVKRDSFGSYRLCSNDQVEIVRFVGGG